jgi:uncharacterized repeat protein (TIGR01451 family)
MSVEMSVSDANLEPMDTFTCTIFFDNTGSSASSLAWINVTLPEHIEYLSDDSGTERGLKQEDHVWKFSSVSEGEHSFDINLQVSPRAGEGEIAIRSSLDYLDKFFIPMLSSEALVTLSIAEYKWSQEDSAEFDPLTPVGFAKAIVSSKSNTTSNNLRPREGFGKGDRDPPKDDKDNGTQDPRPPPPPVIEPETPSPEDIEDDAGEDTGEGPLENVRNLPSRPDGRVNTAIITEDDAWHRNEQPEAYLTQDDPIVEDTQPKTNPESPATETSKISSEIVSNNDIYDTGDVLSFTIFINNTGSQTAGLVWVDLTIPSTVRFMDDTSALIGGKTLGEMNYVFSNMGPGNYEFLIYLSFEGEAEESTEVEVWVHVSYTDSKEDFVGESYHRAKCAVVAQPEQFPIAEVSIAILSTGLMTIVAYSTKEWGTHSLLPFIAPLYSRLKRKEIMDHEARGMIISYVKENPGEHFNSLKSKLDFRNGTLAHHLHILERERVIKSVRYGKYRRFFPVGMMVSRKAYPTELEQEILDVVRVKPGINQKSIAKMVGRSKSTVNYHIDKLRKTQNIRTEKNGLSLRHYISEAEQ